MTTIQFELQPTVRSGVHCWHLHVPRTHLPGAPRQSPQHAPAEPAPSHVSEAVAGAQRAQRDGGGWACDEAGQRGDHVGCAVEGGACQELPGIAIPLGEEKSR